MSNRHRASIGGFGHGKGKTSVERDNPRSFSASRQTIIGYKPNNQNQNHNRSGSAGRESLLGFKPERKSLAPNAFGKPKKKTESKIYLEKKDLIQHINNIFEFLSSHNYENAISKKGLSNGNKHIFLSMLNFLLRLLDRHFKVDLNLVTEEDVLGLLKLIGYSYSFSKNFFAAIGAPNNWTQCLHILNWLVELVKYFEEPKRKKYQKELPEKTDYNLLSDHARKKFLKGMKGLDMDIEESDELMEKLTKRHDHLQVVLKDYELKIENIKLVTQNTLHDFPDPSELEIKISHLKDELFHVQQLIAKHNNENNDKAALNKQKIETIEHLNHQLQGLAKDKQNVMQLVHQQPLTIDESERLTKEINKSEANKNKLLQTKNEKDEKRYKLIQALDDLINELEARSQNFNNIIQSERELFTKCSNFLIRLDHSTLTETRISDSFYIPEQDYLIELCNIDPKNDVKPILREILESLSTHSKQMEDDITSEKFQKQQLEDEILELNSKIEEQNFKLKRITEIYEDKIETLNRENFVFSETRQRLQKDIDELRERLNEIDRQKSLATTNLNNTMSQFARVNQEFASNQKELNELMMADFNLAYVHKKEIIDSLGDIDKKFGKIKQRFEEYIDN